MAEKSFDKAFKQLHDIVDRLQGDQVSIDTLGKELKKASELVHFCKERLREVEEDINKIAEDESSEADGDKTQ